MRKEKVIKLTILSRNAYEMVFSVFLAAIAYLYRFNSQVDYPKILYLFLLLILSNFIFNRFVKKNRNLNLWVLEFILVINILIITGIVFSSGTANSYFWVLYFLPLFAAAFTVDMFKIAVVFGLIISIFAYIHFIKDFSEINIMAFFVKTGIFALSAVMLYKVSSATKKLERAISGKRKRIAYLNDKVFSNEYALMKVESLSEAGKFFSGLSHDLGNIMAVILLSAEVAKTTAKYSEKDINRIIDAAKFGRNILQSALKIAKNEEYKFESADIRKLLEETVEMFRRKAKSRGIEIKLNAADNIPKLKISPVHIQRIVINLLLNSISFMPDGGEIKISAGLNQKEVFLTVEDEGPGFPDEIIKNGVEAFKTTRKEAGGSGLGLYNSDEIIKRHNGKMEISNKESGGSIVKFVIPAEN